MALPAYATNVHGYEPQSFHALWLQVLTGLSAQRTISLASLAAAASLNASIEIAGKPVRAFAAAAAKDSTFNDLTARSTGNQGDSRNDSFLYLTETESARAGAEYLAPFSARGNLQLPLGLHKVLFIAPPGFAKSTYLSIIFPTWYLGTFPDHHILFLTSSDTQASQFNGVIKATVTENPAHSSTFPSPRAAADRDRGWSSNGLYLRGTRLSDKDPAYRAVGYGAHVIGARSNLIILDDPLTQEASLSAKERERAKVYHQGTLDSRLIPHNPHSIADLTAGIEVAIMTRWHEDDLGGFFEKQDDWLVIKHPAILSSRRRVYTMGAPQAAPQAAEEVAPNVSAERTAPALAKQERSASGETGQNVEQPAALPTLGEFAQQDARLTRETSSVDFGAASWEEEEVESSLWPERFPLAGLQKIRAQDPSLFGCLYQGNPMLTGGGYFKQDSFKPLPLGLSASLAAKRLRVVQFWDTAFSEGRQADWSVCVTLGHDTASGEMYVLSVYRRRLSVSALPATIKEQADLWNPVLIGVEEAAFRQKAIRDIVQQARELSYRRVRSVPVDKKKEVRCQPVIGRCEAGRFFADTHAEWWGQFIEELVGFPNMSHDDDVDALSGAVLLALDSVQQFISGSARGYSFGVETEEQKREKWEWGITKFVFRTAAGVLIESGDEEAADLGVFAAAAPRTARDPSDGRPEDSAHEAVAGDRAADYATEGEAVH